MYQKLFFAAVSLVLGTDAALAHATLEQSQAPIGSSYKAVFRVPHGCDGKPTIAVRVRIPEGMIGVKPMPKPGWTLEKVKGPYEKSYEYYHGVTLTEGVKEVIWSGGNLPDDEYDEFVVTGTLAGSLPVGTTLYFPLVQDCPDGAAARWIEIPAEGQSAHDLAHPAPGVRLLEKAGDQH